MLSNELRHHGVKGMKWGVRKATLPNKRIRAAGYHHGLVKSEPKYIRELQDEKSRRVKSDPKQNTKDLDELINEARGILNNSKQLLNTKYADIPTIDRNRGEKFYRQIAKTADSIDSLRRIESAFVNERKIPKKRSRKEG